MGHVGLDGELGEAAAAAEDDLVAVNERLAAVEVAAGEGENVLTAGERVQRRGSRSRPRSWGFDQRADPQCPGISGMSAVTGRLSHILSSAAKVAKISDVPPSSECGQAGAHLLLRGRQIGGQARDPGDLAPTEVLIDGE
jgi:hypothetical protein